MSLIWMGDFEAEIIVHEAGEKHPVLMADEWEQHRVYETMLQHKSAPRSFSSDMRMGIRGLSPDLLYGDPGNYDWFDKKSKQVVDYVRGEMKIEHFVLLKVDAKTLQAQIKWHIEDDSPSGSNVLRRAMQERMSEQQTPTYVVFPFTKFRSVPRPIKRLVRCWDDDCKETRDDVVCDSQFLDDNDNVVLEVRTVQSRRTYQATTLPYGRGERWNKSPKTVPYGREQKQNAIPLVKDYGCAGCDNAEYVVRGPEVYLRCTKYGGEVLETAYDGSYYPDYCGRADAERIRKMKPFLA